ncbi:MAG: carboxypeptidase-like regulatory domain-containing protein [Tannerella sp.]|nr:carboxypeptidase-like regulatory domain-containing protein [Tannerella sp.]
MKHEKSLWGLSSFLLSAILLITPCTSQAEGNAAFQAGKRITGIVVDAGEEPLAGVNVVEKGTLNGTVTDADGNFSLSVAEDAIVQVSFVGYISQEISVLPAWGGGANPL